MKKLYSLILLLVAATVFGQSYTFTTFNTGNSGIAANNVNDFKLSSSGTLWIATNNGLSRMVGNTFTNYTVSNSTIATNMLREIAVSGSNVWASTYQQGLVYRNGTTGAFVNYTMSNSGIPNNMPNGIATDGLGNLWMASSSGLTRFNGTTWTTYNSSNSQINSNDVTSVAVDASNNVWFSAGGMLMKLSGTTITSVTDGVMSILKVTPSGIYINTGDGIGKVVNNQLTDLYWPNTSCLASCSINDVGVDEANKVWLGLDSCGNYEGGIQNFTNCIIYTTSNSALPHNSITSLHVIDSNVIWAGTLEGGLVRMNKTDGPVCAQPTQPYVAQFGQTSAYLAWTSANPAPANGYMYRYNTVNNITGALGSSTSQTGAGIDQLQPNTTYYWWVASACEPLTWVSGGSFTTQPAPVNTCNPPTQPYVAQFGQTTAYLAWTAANPVPGGGYLYRYNTVNNVNGALGSSTSQTGAGIDQLQPGTTYYWWVASACEPLTWVPGGSFTTQSASATCGVPTGLSVTNITSNSSRLNWSAPASIPTSYDLYIVTTNTPPSANTAATVTSVTAGIGVLSGLAPATTYYYWIRSNCSSVKSAWVSGGSFTTIAVAGCNGASNGLYPDAAFTPACTGTNEQIVADAYAGEYSNVNALANKQYTFISSVATDFITITNAAGTTVLASGQTPLSWSSANISGVIRYYLHANANCGSQDSSRIRSIKCVDSPVTACGAPSALSVQNITSNSVKFVWAPSANAPATYQIYCSTSSVAPTASSNPSVQSGVTNRLLAGLNALNTYYYWIRTYCSETSKSAWIFGGSFNTLPALQCNSATYGLYPETAFTPACTGADEQIVANAYAGEYSNVNFSQNKQYTFSTNVGGDYVTITNEAGTTVFASGQAPITWLSGNNAGVLRYYIHSNVSCDDSNYPRGRFIKCTAAPVSTCGVPTTPLTSNITSNSVRLVWNPVATASTYEVYVATSGTPPTDNTAPTTTTGVSNVRALGNLLPSTTYYYWIRSVCGSSKSAWVSGGSFTTIAALSCNGASNGLWPDNAFTPACTGANEQITDNAWGGEYSNVNVVANRQYTFTSSVSTDYLTITNATGTVVLASGLTPLVWNSGTTTGIIRYHLHTNANCGNQSTDRVRSIKCADAPATACGVPTGLAVSNITSNSVRLNWSAPATAPNSYDVYVSATNTAPGDTTPATMVTGATNTRISANILPSATYYYWVRSNCGSSKSAWVFGGNFTTIAALSCNGASYGLYPTATFTPACTGANEQIATDAWAGEYTNVNVIASKEYTFTSSIATDYLTITNATGTTVLASGLTPLVWNSGNNAGVVRYYLHANANCGEQNTARVRSVKCADLPGTPCALPLNLVVTNITSNSVYMDWEAGTNSSVSYEIYYSTSNNAPGANTTPTLTGNPTWKLVPGLAAGTTYYYWIRTVCSNAPSAWVSGGSFNTIPALSCNGATHGLYPSVAFTPACTGVDEVITSSAFAGDFTNVNVLDNKQYTFSSSIATDYLTITNAAGTVVYASGQTPVVWLSGNNSGVIRYYLHSNANCGDQETARIRSIKCANAPVTVCGVPGVPSATNITSNSARIWWAAPATAPSNYDVYISTSSTWPEYNANPTASPMSSILISYSPLAASTTYYYWVRSVCGSSKSDWVPGGSFTTLPYLVCNSATWGLYPEDTVMLQNTGLPEAVAYQSMGGQYSNVGVAANKQYQFTSSITTDYITITNEAGTTVLASGQTPLTWSSGNAPATVRFYIHANANCGPDDMPRDKFAKSGTLGVNDYVINSQFRIYPNPTVGEFSVDTGNTIADKIMIFDNVGRLISTHIPVAAKTALTIDSLSEGVYHVKVYYQDRSSTEKLILRKD